MTNRANPSVDRAVDRPAAWLALGLLLAGLGMAPAARAARYHWLDRPLSAPVPGASVTVRTLEDATVVISDDFGTGVPADAIEIAVDAGHAVHLVRVHDDRDEAALQQPGVTVLRRAGRFALVAIDAPHVATYGGCLGEHLTLSPRTSRVPSLAAKRAVDPEVKATIVDAVDATRITEIVEELSGARAFELGGEMITNNDRHTYRPGSDIAANYLQDRFEGLGYTVERQDFTVFSDPTQNIVAIRTGTGHPEEIVVVGAHYDSIAFDSASGPAPGAEDNGSGTAALLHLAEVLAGYNTDRTLHLVAFGGEEQGIFGSQHYVSQAVAAGDAILGAIILDMVSAYDTRYQIDIEGQTAWVDLMNLFDANAGSVSPGLATEQKFFSFGSDHVPFQNAGIPAFLAIESDYDTYPGYHLTTDTVEKLTPSLGYDVTRAVAATVADLTDPRVRVDVAVLVSGLSATWSQDGVALSWNVHLAQDLTGLVIWRSLDGGPSTPILAAPLPAEPGVMRYVDRDVAASAQVREYALEVVQLDGSRWFLAETVTATTPPPTFWLAQNSPNPFNPRTEIVFSTTRPGRVQLDVYDAAGRRVRQLLDETLPAGPRRATWDGTDGEGHPVASGVFFYRLRHADGLRTRKMLLVR